MSRIMVLRPENPAKAIARGIEILKLPRKEQSKAFEDILTEQCYRFLGYADGYNVVDENGKFVCRIEPGDSFVSQQEDPTKLH